MTARTLQISSIVICVLCMTLTLSEAQQNYKPLVPARHDHPEVPRIDSFAAMGLYKQGKLILANAHVADVYERKHIAASISIPNDKVHQMNIKLPPNMIIAFYCD